MQLSPGTWYKLFLIVQGGWQCGWDGTPRESDQQDRDSNELQVSSGFTVMLR